MSYSSIHIFLYIFQFLHLDMSLNVDYYKNNHFRKSKVTKARNYKYLILLDNPNQFEHIKIYNPFPNHQYYTIIDQSIYLIFIILPI